MSDPCQVITVLQAPPTLITVLSVGQGPAGPPGSSGSGVEHFEHLQAAAAAVWIVNHNLGFRPNVTLTTLGGAEMLAEVLHISLNQVQVFFDDPRSGIALCS